MSIKRLQILVYFHSWSGGKDSTGSIILDHIHGLPPSKIIFSEVMFDKKRNISGEFPEHIDFIKNRAIPVFESWGDGTEIIRSNKDYLNLFYHVVTKSNKPERNGKYAGWVIGGMCKANDVLKIQPIQQFYKKYKGQDITQYVGIATDELQRLERLIGTNKVSLLARYGYSEEMAYNLCKKYNLLSPTYKFSHRGGCWFCPNQSLTMFAYIKEHYPNLWEELRQLSREQNIVSHGFKYGTTFNDVEQKANKIIFNAMVKAEMVNHII